MAPIILVLLKEIAKSITDVNTVPTIPISSAERALQAQALEMPVPNVDAIKTIARYKTAMPNATNKNTGVMVITSLIVKRAAIIPMIMLVATVMPVQLNLQPQLKSDISVTSPLQYMKNPKSLSLAVLYSICIL